MLLKHNHLKVLGVGHFNISVCHSLYPLQYKLSHQDSAICMYLLTTKKRLFQSYRKYSIWVAEWMEKKWA